MRSQNLIIIALLMAITLFTAFHEGYIPLISVPFWSVLIVGFAVCIWLAFSISTRRLLSLILVIFVVEYIKETIGIRSEMWTYHGTDGLYNFGLWAWVLGGLTVYTLSIRVLIGLIKKLEIRSPRCANPIILMLIASLIPLTLGDYRSGAGFLFFSFYAVLLVVSIHACARMDFPIFAGIVITAWFVGNISEYMGSVASGIWTFTYSPDYPPIFLLFGCWPLEILVQYSLSAFLAAESLNKSST